MSDTPRTDAACFAVVSNDPKSVVVWAGVARELERENAALRALVDHAETLLCNSLPMAHCSQVNWDEIIRKWRDQKHAINVNDDTTKLLKACVEYRAMVDRLETENAALREDRDRLVKTASEVLEAFVLHKKVETGHPCPENMVICAELRAAIDAARAKEAQP